MSVPNDGKKNSDKKKDSKRKNEPIKKKLSGSEFKKKRIEKEAAARKNAQYIPLFFGRGEFVAMNFVATNFVAMILIDFLLIW